MEGTLQKIKEYIPFILLFLFAFIFYQIKRFDYLFIAGLLISIIGAGFFVYAAIKLLIGLKEGKINFVYIPFLIFPFLGYSIMKYSLYGVPMESMGAKGLVPSLIRLGMILLGTTTTPAQVVGIWVGFIAMVLGVIGGFYAILDYLSGRITLDQAKKLGYIVGMCVVGGFVTAHLAQTGYMFPVTILSIEGYTIVQNIPLYVIGLILSLLGVFYLLQYLLQK